MKICVMFMGLLLSVPAFADLRVGDVAYYSGTYERNGKVVNSYTSSYEVIMTNGDGTVAVKAKWAIDDGVKATEYFNYPQEGYITDEFIADILKNCESSGGRSSYYSVNGYNYPTCMRGNFEYADVPFGYVKFHSTGYDEGHTKMTGFNRGE